ncbi:MAG: SIR2 family protein [Bellilinea sp.]
MGEQVLLLGNGINDLTNNYNWSNLINALADHLDLPRPKSENPLSFPLLYEKLYLANLKKMKIPENELKSFIVEQIKNLKPNEAHNRINDLGFSEIMTTNYDYVIENSLGFDKFDNAGVVKESTYSVFRCLKNEKTKVWHLHGEINSPNTILLGYEQYSGQLQHIRNYAVSGTKKEYKSFQSPSLVSQIKRGEVKNNSWLDSFLTKDIHIVGLSLEYAESDLWWLITFRARKKLENKLKIMNTIIYYYPQEYEEKIAEKLEMFFANDIQPQPIGCKHDLSYYNRVFDHIENK